MSRELGNANSRPRRPKDRSNFGGFGNEQEENIYTPEEKAAYRRRIVVPPQGYDTRPGEEYLYENAPRVDEEAPYAEPYYDTDEDFYEEGYDPAEQDDSYFEPIDGDLLEYDEFGRKRKPVRAVPRTESKARAVWGWVISIIAAIIIAFVVRAFFFEIILVDGASMQPTLESDERLAVEKVSRYFGLPEYGDIIIVHYPNMDGTYVKRVMGLPGDTIEVKNSTVYRNGEPLAETYTSSDPYADMEAVVVPEDTVFVMGDNRAHSLDSRTAYIGPIDKDEIVGHATFVIWPFDRMHSVG
ncbi:signal peptidase I [Christensenella timonensis]|uniref:signal peptidase I n=1 Tax=Christensenella timonensis TaxID=1816678 RepID=UPI0009ED4CBE|nr:signal peptidase I [Christensenella timonensis]